MFQSLSKGHIGTHWVDLRFSIDSKYISVYKRVLSINIRNTFAIRKERPRDTIMVGKEPIVIHIISTSY